VKHLIVTALIAAFACTVRAQPQYVPHAIWQREGAGDSSLYGTEILALGDQNNDGYNDWAVFASGWGPPGQICEPKVEFFHGGRPPETEPYMVRLTQTPEESYIRGARALGDLNGDGFIDWAIIVNLASDTLQRDVYKIYFGGLGPHEQPDLILTAPWFSDYYAMGDFNGDGFDDILLCEGVNNYAAVYYGGNPMDTIPDWIHHPTLVVMGYGHVNGDRFSDFISDTGPGVGPQIFFGGEHPDTIPAYNFPNLHSGATTIVRDFNGDGFDDLCFSRSGYGGISYGGTSLHNSEDLHLNYPCSGGPEPGGPRDIFSAGDFNHDGFSDVVMLSDYCPDSWYGTLTLHLGHPSPSSEPVFVVYGWTDPFNLIGIRTACNLGDVNGDGTDDLAVGANDDMARAGWRGKVVVLAGDTSLHVAAKEPRKPLPKSFVISAFPNPFNTSTTIRIQVPTYRDEVELTLFNTLGQRVQTAMIHGVFGTTSYVLNASALPTGVFLLQATSGNLRFTTKLVLLK
jgi:hypothetical protein